MWRFWILALFREYRWTDGRRDFIGHSTGRRTLLNTCNFTNSWCEICLLLFKYINKLKGGNQYIPQLVEKFAEFYGSPQFIAPCWRARHLYLSVPSHINPIHTTPSYFLQSRFDVMLPRQGLASRLSIQISAPKICMHFCFLPASHILRSSHSSWFDHYLIFSEQ